MWHDALLVAGKDLRVEVRSRVGLNQVVPFAVLGHKADLGFMAVGPDLWRLQQFQTELRRAGLMFADSYVSLTEVSDQPYIVQESLMNIHRHSGSKTATLRIARTGGRLLLDIEDEGSGIPADKLRDIQTQGSGVGIAGTRERVLHFNGDIRITSVSTGTRIAVTFPVEAGGARGESRALNS